MITLQVKGLNSKTQIGMLLTQAGVYHTYYVKPDEWDQDDVEAFNAMIVERFRYEAEAAGFDVTDYQGRFMYEGVGVHTDETDSQRNHVAVARATSVDLAYESCGLHKIVYPVLITYPEPEAYLIAGTVLKELEVEETQR